MVVSSLLLEHWLGMIQGSSSPSYKLQNCFFPQNTATLTLLTTPGPELDLGYHEELGRNGDTAKKHTNKQKNACEYKQDINKTIYIISEPV